MDRTGARLAGAFSRKGKERTMARDIREELSGLAVIYRMLECGDRISVVPEGDHAFIDPILERMIHDDLIQVEDGCWVPTAKGVALRDRMAMVHDQLLQFEIFGAVGLDLELSADESPDGIQVFDHVYDLRFRDPSDPMERQRENVQDLRVAMVSFLREEMADVLVADKEAFDPRRLVFLRMLADGAFRGDIWFDLRLGKPFEEIDEIVGTAYPWTALAEDREQAKSMMRAIYTAGMLERRKRACDECGKCGIPLALFEQNGPIPECPNPGCRANLKEQRRVREEPDEETVVETVVEETWTDCCEPGLWYDPFDPFLNAAEFALLCCVIW
jgi:hypothetical protein